MGLGRHARQALERLAADDAAGKAVLLRVAGIAQRDLGDLDGARTSLSAASEHAKSAGDRPLEAAAQSSLAFVMARLGELDGAIDTFHRV